MAAGPFDVFQDGLLKLNNGSVDWVNDTIQCMMLTNAYAPNVATQEFVSDIVANEVADVDYARQTLASKTTALASGNVRFDAADFSFGASVTITGKYLVVFKNTGNDATSDLLFVCDMDTGGGSVSSTNGAFDVTVSANGLHEITPNV